MFEGGRLAIEGSIEEREVRFLGMKRTVLAWAIVLGAVAREGECGGWGACGTVGGKCQYG